MHTKERLIDPKLAGGALLDVGIYPLNFASMVLGDDVEETLSSCVKFDSGVDAQNSIILKYKNGSMASYSNPVICSGIVISLTNSRSGVYTFTAVISLIFSAIRYPLVPYIIPYCSVPVEHY